MANRRMFSLDVVDTDAFLDLPLTTQAYYFHLGIRADDGFIDNPKRIQRMVGCNDDDLRLLFAKGFVIPFNSGVCVIRHWKVHNYIRNDRYKKTVYTSEMSTLTVGENGEYMPVDTNGIPDCNQVTYQMETQDRLGKDSIDKDNIDYQLIVSTYNETCISFPKITKLSDKRKKSIRARFNQGYTLEDFKRLFELAENSSFLKGGNNRNWSASFDWLIADANMAKVLDGNYSDRQKEKGGVANATKSGSSFKL